MKRSELMEAQLQIRRQLEEARLAVAGHEEIEAADFGLGDYPRTGLGLIVRVNNEHYCSKWLTLLPGQTCPTHYHKKKTETFFAIHGAVHLNTEGKVTVLNPGQQFTILPGVRHSFTSPDGAVIEEVSTHDDNADSYFDDARIVRDPAIEED